MLRRALRLIPSLGSQRALALTQSRFETTGLERYRKSVRHPDSKILYKKGLADHHLRYLTDEKSTTQMFFRRMRDPYHEFKMLPERGILYAKRLRSCNESVVDLNAKDEVAACIRKRDNFEEIDFVLPRRTAFTMKKATAAHLRQYLIRFPEGPEREVLCTMEALNFHDRILFFFKGVLR